MLIHFWKIAPHRFSNSVWVWIFFGFWCFHLLHLLLSLLFPFKAKQLLDSSSHRRLIYITEVIIVILVSVIPPIITLTACVTIDTTATLNLILFCLMEKLFLPSRLKLCIGLYSVNISLINVSLQSKFVMYTYVSAMLYSYCNMVVTN